MASQDIVRYIVDGEAVDAAVTNRPTTDLARNDRYLREAIMAAAAGQSVTLYDQVMDPALKVGQAVYYKADTQRFEPALASFVNSDNSFFQEGAAAHVWGIVATVSGECGDVLLHGVSRIDLTEAITPAIGSGTPSSGRYYLSHIPGNEGKYTTERPPVAIPVLLAADTDSSGKTLVYVDASTTAASLDSHRHYRFELKSVPAGVHAPPGGGGRHVISSVPDLDVEGWIPADNPSFNGLAPAGAAFGYNIAANESLSAVWPPRPVESAALFIDRGEDATKMGMLCSTGSDGLCIIDDNGIWWMSDCNGDVPWPTDYDTSSPPAGPGGPLECPRDLIFQTMLYFSLPAYSSVGLFVESLTPKANSPITIVDAVSGEDATAGHLSIDINFADQIVEGDEAGHKAVKAINEDGLLLTGPLVESLKVTGAGATAVSSVAAGDNGELYGSIDLEISTEVDGFELPVEIVYLGGAEQSSNDGVPVIVFRQGRQATLQNRITVPANSDISGGVTMKLDLVLAVSSGIDVPADLLLVTYDKIAYPSTLNQSQVQTANPTSLSAIPASLVSIPGSGSDESIFRVQSDAIPISEGETLLITLTRNGDTDGFARDLQIVRMRGRLSV